MTTADSSDMRRRRAPPPATIDTRLAVPIRAGGGTDVDERHQLKVFIPIWMILEVHHIKLSEHVSISVFLEGVLAKELARRAAVKGVP